MATRKIGALWRKERKLEDGQTEPYFSGTLELLGEDIPVVIFKNGKKEKENYPDYIIYRSEPQEKKDINI